MDVNQKDKDGYTALYLASLFGHIDVVNLLLQHPNLKINQQTKRGNTALHIASYNGHTEIAKSLLNHSDIDVNIKNNDGNTPLHKASKNGKTDIVKLLLAHPSINESVNTKNDDGKTPLDIAKNDEIRTLLKEKEEEEKKRFEALPLVKKISEVKEKYKGTRYPPFIQATHDGNVEDVRILLLEDGMDVNQKGTDWYTALHCILHHIMDTPM